MLLIEPDLKAMTKETRKPNTRILADCPAEEAQERLRKAGGHTRKTIP